MRARRPRPPVAEQGTSRAYREGRIGEIDTGSVPPPSRLLFVGVWALQIVAVGLLVVSASLQSALDVDMSPVVFPTIVAASIGSIIMGRWMRYRPPASRAAKLAVGASTVLAGAWFAALILNDAVWHARGVTPAIELSATGFACILGLVIALYRANVRNYRWR